MYSVMEGEIMVVTSNPQNDDIYSDSNHFIKFNELILEIKYLLII